MSLPNDLIDLLAAFDDARVDYLLVGGQAVALHGYPRFTKDADLWLRDTKINVARCQRALVAFGAPPHVVELIETAHDLDVVWMGHPPVRIDLVKSVPGGDFDRAWASHVTMPLGEVGVKVVSRPELIRLKVASGRPQDLIDAEMLSTGT